jgi:hypothetical protein
MLVCLACTVLHRSSITQSTGLACRQPDHIISSFPQSTLMRSIASGKLDGFPPKEVLRTVYVEHDIDASVASSSVVDFVVHDPMLEGDTIE